MKWPRWLRWLRPKREPEQGPPLAAAVMVHGIFADGEQQVACALWGSTFAESASSEMFYWTRIGVRKQFEIDLGNMTDAAVYFQAAAFFTVSGGDSIVLPLGPCVIPPNARVRVGGRLTEQGLFRRLLIPTHQSKLDADQRMKLWAARADELGVDVYCPTCDGECKGEAFH